MSFKIHKPDSYFFNPLHPITISVYGVGGTGSLLLGRLARMDLALRKLGHPGIMVFAYDQDIVTENNIGRQNFFEGDLGLNKAVCLIDKINVNYGLAWEAFDFFASPIYRGNITITCLDNADFRMKLKNFIKIKIKSDWTTRNYYWLDCGNGKDFGQVILSTLQNKELLNVFDYFGNIKKLDNVETQGIQGCSYADSLENQDLFINDIISVQAADMIYKLLRHREVRYNGIVINQKTLKTQPLKVL